MGRGRFKGLVALLVTVAAAGWVAGCGPTPPARQSRADITDAALMHLADKYGGTFSVLSATWGKDLADPSQPGPAAERSSLWVYWDGLHPSYAFRVDINTATVPATFRDCKAVTSVNPAYTGYATVAVRDTYPAMIITATSPGDCTETPPDDLTKHADIKAWADTHLTIPFCAFLPVPDGTTVTDAQAILGTITGRMKTVAAHGTLHLYGYPQTVFDQQVKPLMDDPEQRRICDRTLLPAPTVEATTTWQP